MLIGRTEHEMTAFSPGIGAPEDAAEATLTEFGDGVVRIAETLAAQGHPAYVYRFARRSSAAPVLGATHCAELPFMFDHLDAYAEAPMTGPVDASDRELAGAFSGTMAQFVGSGFTDGTGWTPYRPSEGRNVQRYDRYPVTSVPSIR